MGRQLRKKGACTSPLFHFGFLIVGWSCQLFRRSWPKAPTSGSGLNTGAFFVPKKVSGRWGERPLGRGDGGYCNLKSVGVFRPFCCAREQQNDTQEQTGQNQRNTPEVQPTPDYSPSLRASAYSVYSAQGSFWPVLPSPPISCSLVRKYLRAFTRFPALALIRLICNSSRQQNVQRLAQFTSTYQGTLKFWDDLLKKIH